MKLFLQKNLLRKLPAEIWTLEYLTVLSLRQNKLTYIPASIGRLRHLRELNLACNRLRYLPWELLGLIKGDGWPVRNGPLRNFTVSPNPFFRAVARSQPGAGTGYGLININKERNLDIARRYEEEAETATSLDSRRDALWFAKLHHYFHDRREKIDEASQKEAASWDTVHPLYMSSTPVVYLNIDGSPVDSTGSPPPSAIPHTDTSILATIALDDGPQTTRCAQASSVHSLFELSTKVAAQSPSPSDLIALLPPDTPQPVIRALELANTVKEEEGQRFCSVCGRSYIIPRAEWIEFWHRIPVNPINPEMLTDIGMDELFLPFLRRGCSWHCVPS
jgi:Leucine-rich repeat (LRR) protein